MKPMLSASLAVLALAPATVLAADGSKKYEEVVVSETRVEGPQMPVATSITVITAKDIEISGVTNFAELLRTQAGIQVQDLDGSGGRSVVASMRGFSSNAANNTLILVDGRRLNNPSLAGPDLNSVVLDDIERVEVVHGSAGVLYGDQAVGGVINIITRRPGAGDLAGNFSASHGSDDLERYSASLSQGFGNGLSYRVSGVSKVTDNYRDNNEGNYGSGLLHLRFQGARSHIFVEGQKIDDDLNLAGAISEAQFKVDPRQTNNPDDFSNRETELARFGGSYQLAENWQLLGEYAWRDEDTAGFSWGSGFNQYTRVETLNPRLQGSFETSHGKMLLTLGYDSVQSEHEIPEYYIEAEQEIDAYYGQIIYPLSSRLTFTAGARVSEVEDNNILFGSKHDDELEAYELGLSFQLNETVRLFVRSADAFRFANVDENGFTLPTVAYLKPQTSNSKELGVEWRYTGGTAKLVAYDMDIDDEIYYDSGVYNFSYPCNFPGPGDICDIYGANVNLPSSSRNGFIAEASYQLTPSLWLKGNYTYTDAEVMSGSFDGKDVPYVASNIASLSAGYDFCEQLTLYLDANYTGSRYRLDDDSNASGKLDSDTVVDMNLLWQVGRWKANLRISNLTDRDYSNYNSVYGLYPQPDRTIAGKVTYSF